MSIKVWYVGRLSTAPWRETFARETAKFYVDANGRRTKKESRWYRYFTSEQDAKAVIHARDEMKNQAAAKKRLEDAASELLEALEAAIDCGMVPISTAKEGGATAHSRQVHVADQIRAAIAKATGGEA